MCDCWPLFRDGLKDVTWGWKILMLVTWSAWILVLVVEQSCEFVKIQGASSSSGEQSSSATISHSHSFGRGLTRGRLLPNDSCQPWRNYPDNEFHLDSAAVASYTGAILSIGVGAFVCGYLLITVCCQPFPYFFKWIAAVACLVLAGLQAMTHTITKSYSLCRDVRILAAANKNSNNLILYDSCSTSTWTYNITFATIGLYTLAALLFSFLRLHKKKSDSEDEPTNRNNNNQFSIEY